MEKNGIDRACSEYEGRNAYSVFVGNLRETDHLGDIVVDKRTAFVKAVLNFRFT